MSITRLDSAASAAASTLAYSVSAGADRLLVVLVSGEWGPGASDDDVTAVDYGGQAMVKVRFDLGFVSGNSIGTSIFYLLDAGITAAIGTTITPTFANPGNQSDPMISAASYEGARQDAQVVVEHKGDNVVGASPDPITTIDLIESSGNLIVAGGAIGEPLPEGTVSSWSAAMTEQTDQLSASAAQSLADRLSTTEANQDIELNWVGPVNRQAANSVHFAQVGFEPSCLREASATSNAVSSSTTYEVIPGMELTPGGGDYLAWFSGSINGDVALPGSIFVALFVNGVILAGSEREIHFDSSMEATTFLLAGTHALVQPTDGQVVDVRWFASSLDDMTIRQRTLNLIKVEAADVDEVEATGDDTTTSTSYTAMDSMQITPGAGKYLLLFTTSAEGSGAGDDVRMAVFVDGVILQHTERAWNQESSITDSEFVYAIACEVNPTAGQVVEVRWFVEGGTGTVHERTLTLWKTEQIQEASATSDDSTTSTTFELLDSMSLTPDAGEYLAIFSGYWEGSLSSAHDIDAIIVEGGVEVDHTLRTSGSDGSTPAMDHVVSSSGIVNVDGAESVQIHWRRSAGGTASGHERTLILVSCEAVVEKDATDTLDLEIDEDTAELVVLVGPVDSLDLDLGEDVGIEVEGTAQDDLDLDLGEVVEVEAQAEVEDGLDLEIDPEAAEVSVGLVALDDLDLEIGEDVADLLGIIDAQDSLDEEVNEGDPGIGVEGSAQDSLELDLDDLAAVQAQAEVVDSLDLEVVEDPAQVAVGIGAEDDLDLEILEDPAEVVVVGVVEKIASDLLDLEIDEDTADLLGLIAPIDTTGMGIEEVAEILAKAERLDSLDLSIGEVVDLFGIMDRDDLLDLEIDDQAQVAVILIAQDTLDLEIGEDPGIVIVIGVIEKVASDDLDVEILDASEVDVGITDDDSLGLEVVEEAADLFGLIEPEDTTGLSAEEVEEILARAERLDTLDVDLVEATDLLARLSRSDSLDLEVVEGPGEVVVGITGADDLNLEILEGVGQVVVGIQAEDTLSLALIEATTLLGFLERSDDLNIGIVEGEALVFVALTAQDLLDLEIDDQAEVVILAQVEIVASDTLDLSVVEAVGQVVVAIKATDLLDLSVSEVAEVVGFLNRVDIIDLDLGEQADLLAFIQAADDLDIEVLDASDLVIAIQAADQVDLSIEEVAQVFNAITALDVLDLEITEDSVLNVIVPQFQGIITKAITLETLKECPVTLVATREVVFILEIDPGVQSDH